jgi:hypothetical protein
MSKEFNPTKKDLLTIETLILDIKAKKNVLVNRKISLQNSLSQLRDKYKDVEHNSRDFHRVKNTRSNVKEHLNSLELKIKNLNEELIFKNKLKLEIEFHLKHNRSIETKEEIERVISKIKLLKGKYTDFSKDRTRIASLRVMACEFIDDLNDLIKII